MPFGRDQLGFLSLHSVECRTPDLRGFVRRVVVSRWEQGYHASQYRSRPKKLTSSSDTVILQFGVTTELGFNIEYCTMEG